MKPSIELDLREWRKAANELFQTSSRSMVDFVNGQALKVASLAFKRTQFADRAKIQHQLGSLGRKETFKEITRGKRKGQQRRILGDHTLAGKDTLAHRILGARFQKTGTFGGLEGNTIDELAQSLIKARMRSVNFVRAGWLPAMDKLWAIVKQKPSKVTRNKAGVRIYGKPKGKAFPATFKLRSVIEAMIENTSVWPRVKEPSVQGHPKRIGDIGLQLAVDEATIDMKAELERRLNPDLKRVSAK